jgi:hypothetical protein
VKKTLRNEFCSAAVTMSLFGEQIGECNCSYLVTFVKAARQSCLFWHQILKRAFMVAFLVSFLASRDLP